MPTVYQALFKYFTYVCLINEVDIIIISIFQMQKLRSRQNNLLKATPWIKGSRTETETACLQNLFHLEKFLSYVVCSLVMDSQDAQRSP